MDDMENFFWIGIVGALVALLFAYSQAKKVKQYSEGTPTMQKIAAAIRKGANAYLKRQYKTVGVIFAIIAVVLAVLAYVPWINGQGNCSTQRRIRITSRFFAFDPPVFIYISFT